MSTTLPWRQDAAKRQTPRILAGRPAGPAADNPDVRGGIMGSEQAEHERQLEDLQHGLGEAVELRKQDGSKQNLPCRIYKQTHLETQKIIEQKKATKKSSQTGEEWKESRNERNAYSVLCLCVAGTEIQVIETQGGHSHRGRSQTGTTMMLA